MKKLFPLLTILVFFIVFITACTKIVTTDIGGELLPPIDGVNTKEMFIDVVSKNWKDTIVRVGPGIPNALGYISNDPLFGKTSATINVELKPTTFPLTFPVSRDSLHIDSVVLVLGYAGAWGDTIPHLKLGVYRLSVDDPPYLSSDSLYKTNQYFTKGSELTENNVPADIDITKLNDSIWPFHEAAANQLRIRLNQSFGDELLRNYTTDSVSGAYYSDSLFERAFKGFQITPEQNAGNALLRINLLDTNTKLAIYYRYDRRDSLSDTTVTYFRTNNYTCGSSNYIVHDRTGTDIPSFLSGTNANDSLLFLDANPGIYAKILTDSLALLPNKIIHRAELIIEQVPDELHPLSDTYFTPPALFLTPYSTDSMRRFALPHDVIISGGVFSNPISFGCFPSKKVDPVTQQTYYVYNFDMSLYVQGIVTKHEKVYPLILYAPSNDYILPTETSPYYAYVYTGSTTGPLNVPAIGRVRVGGGSNTKHRMRIHIVYSDVK